MRPRYSWRVARTHCCARAPSEPDVRLSPHPAQASPEGVSLLNWPDPLPISVFPLSAVGVYEAVCGRIVALGCIHHNGALAECSREGAGPLAPFLWALRTVVGGQQERIAGGAALSDEVNATSPSMPAVVRPALCCVTRRTLCSVFDRLRSISFCRLRTRFRSPSCDALKIRRRSRRTSFSTGRHQIASQSRWSSCGPFTRSVSNLTCPQVQALSSSILQRLTWPTSAPLARPGHNPGIRPVIRADR